MSVQITSVEPRVSTELSRLTTAPRRTRSRTPIASASVITGSRPSGTLPAISPTANTIASGNDRPAPSVATGRNTAASTTAMTAISQATRRTWRSSGLCSGLTRSDRAAMRPSSVRMPVATTMALASPPVQVVPLNTRSLACSSGTPESAQSAERATGTDSPVRVEVSTSIVPDSIRASAEIRSPSSSSSTSPGTSWTASTVTAVPSRSTAACCGR